MDTDIFLFISLIEQTGVTLTDLLHKMITNVLDRLNPNSQVFYQFDYCDGFTVYTHWLWYGRQEKCIDVFDDGHGNDWERISVYVNRSNGQVAKVVFHQHDGHYTRRRGMYDSY